MSAHRRRPQGRSTVGLEQLLPDELSLCQQTRRTIAERHKGKPRSLAVRAQSTPKRHRREPSLPVLSIQKEPMP